MNGLPLHLLDEILFRLEPKSLAMMRCTDRYFKSHMSDDPKFEIEYFSQLVTPSLFNVSSYCVVYVFCQPLVSSCDSMSPGKEAYLSWGRHRCHIFGSCSGLLLINIGGLFVVNPLTKRFRILDHSGSKLLPTLLEGFKTPFSHSAIYVGFAVNRNLTTKKFKIVCIYEMQTGYGFEISDGDSWRLSKTTITASSNTDLTTRMKPVYLYDTLHWLRNDGSIIAFNPEVEQARFIPSIFHQEPDMKLFFAGDDRINCLTLISGTKEEISVYTLVENSKWTLDKRIKNVFMEESELECLNVVAYDGKRLVVREKKKVPLNGAVHVYDMEANSWGVLGTTRWSSNSNRDFYKFTPSLYPVEEDKYNHKEIVASNDERIFFLMSVMELIDTTK